MVTPSAAAPAKSAAFTYQGALRTVFTWTLCRLGWSDLPTRMS